MRRIEMLRTRLILSLVGALLVVGGLGVGNVAWGLAIEPGFDLLHTPDGTVVLDPDGDDSLFPEISFVSNPTLGPQMRTTDTIVQRHTGLADGATGRIVAELVYLSLKSSEPIEIDETFFDVFLTLDYRTMCNDQGVCEKVRPSPGVIDVTVHDDVAGGGTFNSEFTVRTKLLLAPVGGTPFLSGEREDVIMSIGTPWSHTTPVPGIPEGTEFLLPSGDPLVIYGNFFPGVCPGPIPNIIGCNPIVDPNFPRIVGIKHTGPHPRTVPVVPEPSTLLLLGTGLVGVLGFSMRQRAARKG
jgi:hypothetical protein